MEKKSIVVFTGAGISAESGLRTFRDTDGLWENHRVEDVASIEGWNRNPQLVIDFYNQRRRDVKAVMPNTAHIALVELENKYDVTIITQNIDDLHERAGSSKVIHLHGEILKARYVKNNEKIDFTGDMKLEDGLRPDVVWFGEPVDMITTAIRVAREASIFIVIGTTLEVFPAAGLIYAPSMLAPRYLVDPSKPVFVTNSHLAVIHISKKATQGVPELCEELLK